MATKKAIEGKQLSDKENERSVGILNMAKTVASVLYHSEFSRLFIPCSVTVRSYSIHSVL